MNIMKEASYLKGLMDGLKINESTNEGKVLVKVADLIDKVCEEICLLHEELEDAWQVIDELDENLRALENDVIDDYEEGFCECFCVKCPNCGSEHYMKYEDLTEEELENNAIKCPNCKAEIDLDDCLVDEDFEGCDCGCGKADCCCDDDCDCEN